MRNILVSSFIATTAALAFFACGGTDPIVPVDAGNGGDVIKPPSDGGKDTTPPGNDSGPTVDIKGSTALKINAVSGPGGFPKNLTDKGTALDGAGVRVENKDGTGFIDGVTDSSGSVTISVDLAKGPFNVTVAKVGFGVASVMGVTAAGDLTKLIWVPQPLVTTEKAITGAITGLKDPVANKVQIDSAWFATVFSNAAPKNYQTKHVYVPNDTVPVNLAGIEINPANDAVQGEWMPDVARVNGPMTADLTFDSKALLPKKSIVTINMAATGQFTGAMVKYVGDLTSAKVAWTNTTVAKSVGLSAAYVGIAVLQKPTANVATMTMQSFDTPMKPDYASAFFTDQAGNGLNVNVTDFSATSVVTVPPIAKLDVGANASALDDAKITADGTGADFIAATLSDSKSNSTVWVIYFPGLQVAGASLPHLPASVNLGDVSSAANLFIDVAAIKTPTKPVDWSDGVGGVISNWSYSNGAQIAATGR